MDANKPQFKPEQQKVLDNLNAKLPELLKETYPDVPDPEYYINQDAIRRFAVGHEFKEDLVIEKWKNWVQWRTTYKPHEISEDEEIIEKQVETGKLKWYKHDKEKRPCLYYKMRFHQAGLATGEETIKYFIYMFEKGLKRAEKLGTEKVVVIYDRRGYGKQNNDPKSVDTGKLLMPIFQDYYPERLHCFIVLGANWFYRFMFGLVKTFISKKTIEKMRVLGDDKDLLELFDQDQLPAEYGGVSKNGQKPKPIANSGEDSEDESELKKIADNIYKSHGMAPPKLEEGAHI